MRLTLSAILALAVSSCGEAGLASAQEDGGQDIRSEGTIMDALDEQRERIARAGEPRAADSADAFVFDGLVHDRVPLAAFADSAVLVVNTASRCGFTPQYAELQEVYDLYKDRGLVVIGVPSNDFGGQEPGSEAEIEAFCRLNFGVTFPMTAKYAVTGPDAHPFFAWARQELGSAAVPKWNFHKILLGRDGRPVAAFPSTVTPKSPQLIAAIESAIAAPAAETTQP